MVQRNLKRKIQKVFQTSFFLLLSVLSNQVMAQDLCKPVGWATQNNGVTGGGNATPVVVSNYNDLKSAITDKNVKVVHVKGVITFPTNGRINIQDQSGKTIFGLPGSKIISVDMTSGGSGLFYVKRMDNFILRNMHFEGPGAYDNDGNDNLTVDDSRNVWVDHCEFHDGMDGNFDIKNKSDYISVTWCKFSYEKPPKSGGSGGSSDHRYTNLIGSSDGATGDRGKLRITFQYCWWAEGCKERMPRIRFGKVHLVNNYYSSSVANQGIRAGFEADVRAEGNYFISGYTKPIDEFEKNYTAIYAKNNSGASDLTKGSGFSPPYSIAVASASSIVSPIKSCAGATLTSTTACSSCSGGVVVPDNKAPSVSITSPSNKQQFTTVPASITINVNAADSDGTVAKVEFYNGTTKLGEDNSSAYSYTWNNVAAGTYTLTAVATDNKGAKTTSAAITVTVGSDVIGGEATLTKHGVGSSTQTIAAGESIAMFYYDWTNATTVKVTGLPAGIVAEIDNDSKTVTLKGTPTQSGTFNYTVTTVGPSTNITKSGIFTITGNLVLDCLGDINGTAYRDQCGVCVGGKSAFKTCAGELQGETACSVVGIQSENTNAGFLGDGYVNTENALGASVSWILNATSSQTATITFRYANGGDNTRNGNLTINGSKAVTAIFDTTGAWSTWKMFSINIELVAGSNELVIAATSDEGLANIDILYFSEGVADAGCTVTASAKNVTLETSVYPNPTHNNVQLSQEITWSLHNSLGTELNRGIGSHVNLSSQPTGVYFLKLENRVVKLIKE